MKGLHCTPAAPGQLDIARLYPQASAESARVSFLYSKVIKSLYHDYYPVALSRHSTRIHRLPLIMLPRRFLVTWILGTLINSNFNRIIWLWSLIFELCNVTFYVGHSLLGVLDLSTSQWLPSTSGVSSDAEGGACL